MKKKSALLIVVIFGAIFVFASGFIDIPSLEFTSFESGCRIMKPVWGFYKCEQSSNTVAISGTVTSPTKNVFDPISAIRYKSFYCNLNDIVPNAIAKSGGGFASCSVTTDSSNMFTGVVADLYYKTCTGSACSQYWRVPHIGHTVYLDFGEYVVYQDAGTVWGELTFAFTMNYYQKQLIYHDWFGFETQTKGVGCELGSVLGSVDYSKLPKDAKLSMDIDERLNFVVSWIDLAMVGNVFDSPKYGDDLICTPQRQFYKIKTFEIATQPDESGSYYDKGGNCYMIPEASPVASVECCPAEQLPGGYSCNLDGEKVSLDKGECVIGGIASAINCAGGGGYFCDLGTHNAYSGSTCNSATGMCEYIGTQYAECCPPDKGCAGDQYCDIDTFKCKTKDVGLFPCNSICCDPEYHPNHQEKKCTTGICCPNSNTCAESLDKCGAVFFIEEINWFAIIISLLAFGFITSLGLFLKNKKYLIVTGIVGAGVGYLIYWFLTLPWWASLLLTIGIVGGGIAILYVLMTLGILSVLVIAVIMAMKKNK